MRVTVSGAVSEPVDVTSGVPQGSVLGPVLFLLYVNHIAPGLQCYWKAFADDFKLYLLYQRGPETAADSVVDLQRSLDQVSVIAASWNLSLTVDKCVTMRFYTGNFVLDAELSYNLNGIRLKSVDSHKDLGVIIDNKFKFHIHIRSIVGKAAGLAGQLVRSIVCRNPVFMVSLFVSHVRSIIDYCCCVWNVGYIGDMKLIESVQRRWTKQINGLEGMDYGSRL